MKFPQSNFFFLTMGRNYPRAEGFQKYVAQWGPVGANFPSPIDTWGFSLKEDSLCYLTPYFPLYFLSVSMWGKVKVAQSCPTLCNPMDYAVHGILQAWRLELFPSPGDLPNTGIEPRSPKLQVFFTSWAAREALSKPKKENVGRSTFS